MTKPPCFGCKKRTAVPNCHSNCQLYLEWQTLHNAERAEERKAIGGDTDFIGFTINSANKCQKRRRARGRKG